MDVLTRFAGGSLRNLTGETDHVSVRGSGLPDGPNLGLAAPMHGEGGVVAGGIGFGQRPSSAATAAS